MSGTDRPQQVSALDARDDLLELADRYETVGSLDVSAAADESGVRRPPGSRLPPGMQEILDAEEVITALGAVAEWAEFIAHVVADECGETMPDLPPARLRTASRHAGHLVAHDDELFALSVLDDLAAHLRTLRRLSGRGVRRVRTGMRCQVTTCSGALVSPLGTDSVKTDAALVCDKCGASVPYTVWSSWPKARVTYVTVEHAARMAGTTVPAIKMRASRSHWRKVGTGRDVRYHVDDVRAWIGVAS